MGTDMTKIIGENGCRYDQDYWRKWMHIWPRLLEKMGADMTKIIGENGCRYDQDYWRK